MFGKLLKHEFNSVKGTQFALWLATLISGIVGGLMMWLFSANIENPETENVVLMVTAMFTLMGAMFAIVGCTLASSIMLWIRFYRNKFTDEGYLTFTLPVTTHQILLSSILNIVIWNAIMLVTVILSFVGIFLPLGTTAMQEAGDMFRYVFLEVGEYLHWYDIALQIFNWLSSAVYSLIMPLLCITIGCQIAKKYKLLASFGIYYALSMVISILSGILSVVMMTGEMALGGSGDGAYYLMTSIPYILYLCIGVGGYFIMHHQLDQKLNLN